MRLGFLGVRLIYIALGVQHDPLDQIDLSNCLDASSKAVGDQHMKLANRWDQGGQAAPPIGWVAPPIRGGLAAELTNL